MGNCGGRIEWHHIINRSKVRGNKKARKYIDHRHLRAWVCTVHNVGRDADSPEVRKYLLYGRGLLHGEAYMRDLVNNIPWKVVHHELTWDGIMANDFPDSSPWVEQAGGVNLKGKSA